MANMTVSRIGQINASGDADALFLKVFSGEVLTAFRETTQFISRHMVRSITSGKSAQFPASWKGTASYHTPGTQLVGSVVNHNERIIVIDDLLVADRFIANIDEAKTHYDVRSEYSYDMGRALANAFDSHVAQVGILAARASATVSGGDGGTQITDADARTNGDSLVGSILDAAQALDEKNVPSEDRFCFLKPAVYYNLLETNSKAISRDYNPEGNGSIASGNMFRVGGIELVKTNNLPQTNISTGPTPYQGNYTNTAALIMHRSAAGTVKLMDVATEGEYLIEYQGTLMVAKYAIGHGILRPESAVEIKVA